MHIQQNFRNHGNGYVKSALKWEFRIYKYLKDIYNFSGAEKITATVVDDSYKDFCGKNNWKGLK